jgi:hypothetical protein
MPSQFQQVSSNRGGFFEQWSYIYRSYSTQSPTQQVLYSSSVTDTNTGETVVSNGKPFVVDLPPVNKLIRGIRSSNPINQFTFTKIQTQSGRPQYWLAGSVSAMVTPVEPGHSVALFYRLHVQDSWSSVPMNWIQNQASGVDPSFLIRESWNYAAPIVFDAAPSLPGLQFQFYVVCRNSIRNETFIDDNGGQYFSSPIRLIGIGRS